MPSVCPRSGTDVLAPCREGFPRVRAELRNRYVHDSFHLSSKLPKCCSIGLPAPCPLGVRSAGSLVNGQLLVRASPVFLYAFRGDLKPSCQGYGASQVCCCMLLCNVNAVAHARWTCCITAVRCCVIDVMKGQKACYTRLVPISMQQQDHYQH
jgi:hypothetical protein